VLLVVVGAGLLLVLIGWLAGLFKKDKGGPDASFS
jgi:hypothetical protein